MTDDIALELTDVSHRFDKSEVLKSVTLTVRKGDITALVGPSGSGKSTLLRIIAGLEQPTRGVVRINGITVADERTWVPAHKRKIALVPQDGALFPHLSVTANIAFGLTDRKSAAARERVKRMLDLVGLPNAGDLMPSELSGGMQQRVALARALATEPAVVLLDEPFSALDAGLRESLRDQVVDILHTAGATALWVTHDQDEALSTADRVCILLDGHIAQSDDPVSTYHTPTSVETARFIGETVSMNGLVTGSGRSADTPLGPVELLRHCAVGPATVIVRPEQFEITSPEDAEATAIGRVVATRYFGHDGTVDVEMPNAVRITVRLHARLLPAVDSTVGLLVHGKVLAFRRDPV